MPLRSGGFSFWEILTKMTVNQIKDNEQKKYKRILYISPRVGNLNLGDNWRNDINESISDNLTKQDMFPVLLVWEDDNGNTNYAEVNK